MPAEESLSDSHIAELLKKDAADRSLRYSAMGLQAFLPKRPTINAPKPNTRFLRNIIRETDSHNAALQAKEADESRARLRALKGEPESRGMKIKGGYGCLRDVCDVDRASSDRESRHSKHKRLERDDGWREKDYRKHRRRRSHESSRRGDHGERENRKGYGSIGIDGLSRDRHIREDKSRKRRRSRSGERYRRRHDGDREHGRRHRSYSRNRASAEEPEKDERHSRTRRRRRSSLSSSTTHQSRSPPSQRREPDRDSVLARSSKRKRTASPVSSSGSESDPLAAIIGPPPPPPEPKVRSRGRGTFTSSAMDTHFSSTYDPTTDVRPNSDSEDDWDQALEALRDRKRWNQQGAERLRSAGFTDDEIKKWESGALRKEEDVRWAKKGEGREWDRGKIVDDDGHVEVKPEWGRLKGT